MMDPLLQNEVLESWEVDFETCDSDVVPKELNKEWTIELVKEANDKSLAKFKELYPVII